ncbi:MAG: helix-turn-helix domain-containing protein [Candidatus Thiodiazotropha sp. 'RUGA']|nr:helix-turn-helix domain-containing protein [Candidatus Thiodiazotropha sp. 'RUGA']
MEDLFQRQLVVTYAEAGKILMGISERTVRRLVAKGDLPFIKIGGRVGIPYEALCNYVSSKTQFVESKQRRKRYLTADQIAHTGGSRTLITPADRLAELVKLATSKKQKA